ncbi:hypothetical protein [Candidatus Palauibacter sp.]|uniref:hypothetical protein n=1 Tax=Candidatus Palauibacter sp. TaxID=3101350 RepID=UPI003B02991D
MHRFANSLLLIALVLPYARAPLCQAGSHEHADHHHAGMVAAFASASDDGPAATGDCHSLMGCTVVLQASLAEVGASFRALAQAWDPALQGGAVVIPSRASPDTPPPRTA